MNRKPCIFPVSHFGYKSFTYTEVLTQYIKYLLSEYNDSLFCIYCRDRIETIILIKYSVCYEAVYVRMPDKKKKEKENTSIQNIINKLSVSGQIKLAMKGNKEARSILIRSPKKLVAQAVLQNPKINENEVEFYSKLKNLSEELLRTIARNPDWVKKPSIMRGLLYNPKTPASIAMTFLSRVTKKEVRDISKSKSLPQAIRIAAKRIVMQEQAREDKLKRAAKK